MPKNWESLQKTVEISLLELEKEALLVSQGPGNPRLIAKHALKSPEKQLRIAIQLFDSNEVPDDYIIEFQHLLGERGHHSFFTTKSLVDFKFDVTRFSKSVRKIKADAWVVIAGSYEILKYLSDLQLPTFAMAGRHGSLPIAGTKPDIATAIREATEHLINLGHHRIVLINRDIHRKPEPSRTAQSFIDVLKAHDITVSSFNLPDWEETPQGLRKTLDSLFQLTKPTAIITDELNQFFAVQQYLGSIGLKVPNDVSLISSTYDAALSLGSPSIAHFHWERNQLPKRLLRWADAISRGRNDRKQSVFSAKYIDGGTVAPPVKV